MWAGVNELLRRKQRVYGVPCHRALLYPLATVVLSELSANIDGTLEIIQEVGIDTFIEFWYFRNHLYTKHYPKYLMPVRDQLCKFACKWNLWRCRTMQERYFVQYVGVSLTFFFQFMFTPHSVLLSGSDPIVTFEVRACSERCCNVPLIWKFLEKSYSQLIPNIVFGSVHSRYCSQRHIDRSACVYDTLFRMVTTGTIIHRIIGTLGEFLTPPAVTTTDPRNIISTQISALAEVPYIALRVHTLSLSVICLAVVL